MQFTAITTLFLASATFGLADPSKRAASVCTGPSQPDRTVPAYKPLQTKWGECGGNNYDGPTRCADGWSCKKQNEWYSQCLEKKGEKKSDEQDFYGQCGGKDYQGPTKCAYPGTCQKQNDWYSQCL